MRHPLVAVGLIAAATASLVAGTKDGICDNLKTARNHASSITLRDGRVLIVGGLTQSVFQGDHRRVVTAKVELLDPVTGTTRVIAPLHAPRAAAHLAQLDDGRVLVTGGYATDAHDTYFGAEGSEIWDPVTETFTFMPDIVSYSSTDYTSVAQLPGNRLLIPTFSGLIEMDMLTGRKVTLGVFTEHLMNTRIAVLPDGRVLVIGTSLDQPGGPHANRTLQLWDPATGIFEPIWAGPERMYPTELMALPNGKVLMVGGDATFSLLALFDPATESVVTTGSTLYSHFKPRLLLTQSETGPRVSVIMGYPGGGGESAIVESINAETGEWMGAKVLRNDPIARAECAVNVSSGKVFLLGGTDDRRIECYPEATF